MAAMEAANGHYHNGHQQPGPPLPASPTLTNPDMILPDYDRSDSPNPDLGERGHTSLEMWNSAHAVAATADMHRMFVATGLVQRVDHHPYGPAGPVTPTTPIIYGNGTMLSDIGEVTEVESTVGKPSPSRTKFGGRKSVSPARGSGGDGPLRSSPTITPAAMIKKMSKQSLRAARERRSSLESTSTITTDSQAQVFADFDDSVSVGDSVFQGDDEESLASSYVEGTPAIETSRLGIKGESVDRLSTYSAASLSRRAEEILANAKKRLTTMEGNLTRARSSLNYTSTYGSDGSTPSPPFQRASTAVYSRGRGAESTSSTPDPSPGHARMASDIAMRNGLPYRVTLPRSQSALGAAGGYRQPLTASKSADHIRRDVDEESGRPTYKLSSAREDGLQPLTEEEVARLGEADRESQNARLEAFLSPTFGSFENGSNVRRSASSVQMRDIKDQMKDLKGKISSLREQARADSLKRHSLQSLRTPSPFTHSQIDQWYAEPRSNRTSEISTSTYAGRNPWNGEESSVDGDAKDHARQSKDGYAEEEDQVETERQLGQFTRRSPEPEPSPVSITKAEEANGEAGDDISDMLTEDGDTEEDHEDNFQDADDVDYQSESGESLYHDTVQHQISHEDREDAFDYEHFFLHSAMGTMSQQRLMRRGSTESFTSEDSVETTRGPVMNDYHDHDQSRTRTRRNSSDSISTIETFATAEDGGSRRSAESPDGASLHSHDTFESCFSRAIPSAQSNRYRSGSSATAKRLSTGTYPSASNNATTRDSDGSISPIAEEGAGSGISQQKRQQQQQQPRRHSVIHRPLSTFSTSNSMHRPSVSSFDSAGTNRSFPLVNKPGSKASSTGILTPRESPDQELEQISSALMSETISVCEKEQQQQLAKTDADANADQVAAAESSKSGGGGGGISPGPHPLQALLREDKYLVERIIAGLGRCVLGLTENGRASAESRMYRRRIDAARRILEGLEEV